MLSLHFQFVQKTQENPVQEGSSLAREVHQEERYSERAHVDTESS